MEFLGSFRYNIMSSINRDILTSSFHVEFPFISSFLTALIRNIKVISNNSGESEHPCSVPYFRRNVFSFSPFCVMLAIVLSYIAFVILRYIPSAPSFIRVFIMKEYLMLSNTFYASIEMIMWILSLLLLTFSITFI
jgi:hypothetical protein